MKKIVKYIALAVVLTGAFSACIKEKDPTAADMGLGIKTFFPTKVVAGQPMTINGNGLADVTEIVFPGDVTVTNFQLVGGEMIRVNAPQGIAAEGGKLVIRTADDEAVSSADLTLGHTVISGYSKQEGESIQGGEELKIYGKDLEFISGIELMDADGNPMLLDDTMFYRKGTSVVSILIPKKTIYDGTFVGKVFTVDSQEFDMPSLKYSPAAQGGHWETVKTVVWTNEDPAGNGAINWSGTYRFGLEGHDGNNECIATFGQEVWEKLIGGPFHIKFVPAEGFDSYQIRICNGWWTEQWMADDIMAGSEAIVDNGDGTFSVAVDVTSNPEFVATLEEKHLLITGSGFIPLELYFEEEVFVNDDGPKEVDIWKNEDVTGNGAINWSGTYRFGLEGHDGNNECIATFGQEVWEKLIGGPFHIKFVPAEGFDSYQIRICNGWWTEQWMADDIMAGSEAIVDNGDGTFSVAVDVTSNPDFVATLEEKHLLITGSGFIPLRLYFVE